MNSPLRRVIFVAITESALELLARLDGPVREPQKGLFSHMSEAELEALIRLLERKPTLQAVRHRRRQNESMVRGRKAEDCG